MIQGYDPAILNTYYLGGIRVPGSENPGSWQWEDGTDVVYE